MTTEQFTANLTVLPAPQLELWAELGATPNDFVLYGGTALALHLGHRVSVDFNFFSNEPFGPDDLARQVPYLRGAERVQIGPNTLKCRIERADGPVLVSFFGDLGYGQALPRVTPVGLNIQVASLLDIGATKMSTVQQRAEAKDYLDIDALLEHGLDLSMLLAAAGVAFGPVYNPVITLKALSYFGDLPTLSNDVRVRLSDAVANVDLAALPVIEPIIWSRHRI